MDNPYDSLHFDEQLVASQFDLRSEARMKNMTRADPDLKLREMIQDELQKTRERARDVPKREHFFGRDPSPEPDQAREPKQCPHGQRVVKCKCGKHTHHCRSNSDESDSDDDQDFLPKKLINSKAFLFFVFILAVFCITQYYAQRELINDVNELRETLCDILKRQPAGQATGK